MTDENEQLAATDAVIDEVVRDSIGCSAACAAPASGSVPSA